MAGSTSHRAFISSTPAGRGEWLFAILFLSALFLAFLAAVPYVRLPLAAVPSFIPAYESALFISDLITAVLFLAHFVQLRSRAVLALAAGYLFDALMIIPHVLTFPGVFSPTGFLGAGTQTTAWLYHFWHAGFPLFVLAYVFLRSRDVPSRMAEARLGWMVGATALGVVALVCVLSVAATAGEPLLPRVIVNGDYTVGVSKGISPTYWVVTLAALVALWRPQATVLDLWLMVVMGAWLMDIGLSAVIGASRYDLGFYAGRIYGLIAASVVLVALLIEMARERRAIARQLVQTQKMEAVGQLTGGIAHDFNNLLAGVIGNLELAIDEAGDRPELRGILDDALQSALRGADLVKRLLAFSRIQPLQLRSLDLPVAINRLLPLLRSSLGEQVSIDVIMPDGLWPVRVDQSELENTVLNLCINARDAMSGGGQITIEASNFVLESWFAKVYPELKLGEYVVLSINDSGCGMPPEVIARAFEPFFTTKETGKGSGLGLSMVHGYMRQSGGAAKIYSEVGVGTTISLYFPRGASVGAGAGAGIALVPGETAIPRGTERVLVVEDNPPVRKVAVGILQSLGYRVEQAESAPAALAVMKEQRFDAVFSDVVMPEMNGIAFAEEVRRLYPDVRVLLTSGFSSKLYTNAQIRTIDADLVAKPYRKMDLAVAIRAALDKDATGGP
jgi:signal transduction histidine kinase/ActR/RegA family two-component response regulator